MLVAHPGAELYGSDRMLWNSVIGLVQSGAEVVVALPQDGPLCEAVREAGARVIVVPAFVLRKRLMQPSGWPELLRTGLGGTFAAWRAVGRIRPDVIYVSTLILPLWPVLGRLRGVPVALHIHEADRSIGRAVETVLYGPARSARRILVNSEFTRDVMTSASQALGPRAVLVPNAVPGPAGHSPPRARLDGGLRVVFVGRLSPRKGADLAIEAIRILDARGLRASLDIVGSVFEGKEDYEQSLRRAIADAGLQDRVILHGFQSDVWRFLDRGDVLVMPSRLDESFGNTAVEAILAARPVVVSDMSGLRDATAGIGTAWRVTPDSAAAIADALADIVEHWPQVRAGVERARRLAADRHSPERYQRRVAELVTTLPRRVSGSARRRPPPGGSE